MSTPVPASPPPPPPPDNGDRRPPVIESAGEFVRTARSWGEQQLPRYMAGFLSRIREAGRLLWTSFSRNDLTSSGIDVLSTAIALGLTVTLYLACNIYLSRWVEKSYREFRPELMKTVSSQEDARQAFIAAGWVDEAAAEKSFSTSNATFARPFHAWIEQIFLQTGVDTRKRELAQRLHDLTTGERSGWLVVNIRSTTGLQIYEDLVRLEGPQGHIATTVGANSNKKRLFIAMADELLGSVQEPIRWIYCIHGSIQFLTVLVSFFVLTAIARRFQFILKLDRRWVALPDGVEHNVSASSKDSSERELEGLMHRARSLSAAHRPTFIGGELDRIRSEVDRVVYDVYWFIAGILPSLGFIGTVVGMSAALLKADRLFLATDRQLAIADMTKELGLAFDTTLVALLMGILVSIPLSTVRARELSFYREFAERAADAPGSIALAPTPEAAT